VVLTGTPAGTGDETKTYLCDGDVVEVEVAGLPALRSLVVDGRVGRPG
jgi:2-keto-4-pentenoate hydratase/2-oxohepta-3-ene-1,7-dioic acid hydratase in catechol pathway